MIQRDAATCHHDAAAAFCATGVTGKIRPVVRDGQIIKGYSA